MLLGRQGDPLRSAASPYSCSGPRVSGGASITVHATTAIADHSTARCFLLSCMFIEVRGLAQERTGRGRVHACGLRAGPQLRTTTTLAAIPTRNRA